MECTSLPLDLGLGHVTCFFFFFDGILVKLIQRLKMWLYVGVALLGICHCHREDKPQESLPIQSEPQKRLVSNPTSGLQPGAS